MSRKELVGDLGPIPLSPALKTNDLVFVSGQVPIRDDGSVPADIAEQTRIVLDKIHDLLEAANSSMDRVVKTTVFLTDKADFAAMNGVYAEYFTGIPPTRSTIECGLMIDIKVEIEAVALV